MLMVETYHGQTPQKYTAFRYLVVNVPWHLSGALGMTLLCYCTGISHGLRNVHLNKLIGHGSLVKFPNQT